MREHISIIHIQVRIHVFSNLINFIIFSGHQKIDGVFGALIVRQPIEKVQNSQYYDFDLPEHLILASDWMHSMAENHLPGMARRSALSSSMLVNGRGRFLNVIFKFLSKF